MCLCANESQYQRSTSYHVMGNLESACENLKEALEYFNRALDIRTRVGDSAASLLAITYICIARAHYLKGEYSQAIKLTDRSEALFVRSAGPKHHFLAQYDNLPNASEAKANKRL